MIGALRSGKFQQFYADRWDDEPAILEAFLRCLPRSTCTTLVSYSGTGFDRSIVHQRLLRYGLDHRRFSAMPHVDLCHEVKRHFILPISRYGVKEVADKLGYRFAHPDLDGLWVALAYEEHIRRREPLDPRMAEYNEDDVRALPYIVHQLEKHRQALPL